MLDRDTIVTALTALSARLGSRGVSGEINLLGGTAMVLGFQARQSTKDVDAIFAPAALVREEALAVANELGLEDDWLNDAAKGFASPVGEFQRLPDLDMAYLRVQVPRPEYLLSMKVMAARAARLGESGDKEDIRFLIRLLRLTSAEQVMAIVQTYYDPARILPRSVYLVEEIIAEEST